MAGQQRGIQIEEDHVDLIRNMTLEPIKNPRDTDHLYVKFTAIYDNVSNRRQFRTRYEGISREDELSFFYKLNHLVYRLEKKNIQDIIKEGKVKNNDIFHVLNYLFKKYKSNEDKLEMILRFVENNFNLQKV